MTPREIRNLAIVLLIGLALVIVYSWFFQAVRW